MFVCNSLNVLIKYPWPWKKIYLLNKRNCIIFKFCFLQFLIWTWRWATRTLDTAVVSYEIDLIYFFTYIHTLIHINIYTVYIALYIHYTCCSIFLLLRSIFVTNVQYRVRLVSKQEATALIHASDLFLGINSCIVWSIIDGEKKTGNQTTFILKCGLEKTWWTFLKCIILIAQLSVSRVQPVT